MRCSAPAIALRVQSTRPTVRVAELGPRILHQQSNWAESDYTEFLDALRDHLTTETRFTPEQLAKIRWSLDEIIACGRELEEQGKSGRSATEAVDYLILRVVDWCKMHPRENDDA